MFEKNIIKCIRLEPENSEFYLQLEGYYKTLNDKEKLITLYSEAFKNTKNKIFEIKLKNLIETTPVTEQINSSETLSDVHLVDFLNLFEGLKNIYARQWVTEDGKAGYVPVREPLTVSVIRRHLNDAITIGVYPVNEEGKVKFAAFDLDVQKFAQEKFINEEDYREMLLKEMQGVVRQIVAILKEYQIPGYIEFSGFKGFHVWIFFKKWISASAVKQFGKKITNLLTIGNLPFHVEFFPKQTKASLKNPGNLIKLPLGLHLKSRKKSYFVDQNFNKVQPDLFITEIVTITPDKFYNALKSLPASPDWKEIEKISKTKEVSKSDKKEEESDFILENDVKFQWIYNKCYAIRTIVDKINNTYEITNNEFIVLSCSIGKLDNGAEIVNALLRKCVNVTPDQFMKSKYNGHPISCAKIKHRLQNSIDLNKCNCEFPHLINYYPTPLAHLEELPYSTNDNKLEKLKIRIMIENYLRMKKELSLLNQNLNKTENELKSLLQDVDVSQIETSLGKVLIKLDNGKLNISIQV